ncbi:MAG: oligosaccharide flippase family protein, partial [Romboutsia sp.]|nr:oligosaccharide flippase family protein [Romboutsia sp.]
MIDQLKKISIVSAGNIFNAVLGILFLAAVARSLGIDDVGKYAILTTLLVSTSKIIDFGSNSAFVAESIMSKRDVDITTFILLKFLLFIPALVIGTLILKLLGLLTFIIFSIYMMGLIAYGFNITLFTLFQKNKLYGYAVLLNTFPAILKGLFAILIFITQYTNLSFIDTLNLEQAYAIFSLAMFSCIILIFKLPRIELSKRCNIENIKELFIIGAPGGIALLI